MIEVNIWKISAGELPGGIRWLLSLLIYAVGADHPVYAISLDDEPADHVTPILTAERVNRILARAREIVIAAPLKLQGLDEVSPGFVVVLDAQFNQRPAQVNKPVDLVAVVHAQCVPVTTPPRVAAQHAGQAQHHLPPRLRTLRARGQVQRDSEGRPTWMAAARCAAGKRWPPLTFW